MWPLNNRIDSSLKLALMLKREMNDGFNMNNKILQQLMQYKSQESGVWKKI
jgi:hypothetical protein